MELPHADDLPIEEILGTLLLALRIVLKHPLHRVGGNGGAVGFGHLATPLAELVPEMAGIRAPNAVAEAVG
jgi:hypothetical protein